jgi:hypothetical protein
MIFPKMLMASSPIKLRDSVVALNSLARHAPVRIALLTLAVAAKLANATRVGGLKLSRGEMTAE